jgi:CyaY protein
MMDESRYNLLVSAVFKKLITALDEIDPDLLDAESTGDMVTVTSRSGEKCIVNTQRAVRQLWVAGKSQGIHFAYDEKTGRWMDDKGKGLELFAFVADVVKSIASGAQLTF